MKAILAFVFFTSLILSSTAQDKPAFKRFGFGLNYAFITCFYKNDSLEMFHDGQAGVLKKDKASIQQTGLVFYYNITRNLNFQTKLLFLKYYLISEWHALRPGLMYSFEREIRDDLFIAIPLSCNLNFGFKKIRFNSCLGVTPLYLYKKGGCLQWSDDFVNFYKIANFNFFPFRVFKGFYGPFTGIGVEYIIRENLRIKYEIEYQYKGFIRQYDMPGYFYYWNIINGFSLIYNF